MKAINSLSQLDLATGVYSYADYLTWQFDQAVELIKGHIFPMSAPSRRHQRISWQLTLLIGNHFRHQPCQAFAAPFDVRLTDKRKSEKANREILTVVQPDICIICDETKLDDKGCLGAPDLVVEILSPGNSAKEMKIKKALYEENGVREYWIIDPEHTIAFQFHLTEADQYGPVTIYVIDDTLTSAIFPDLAIPLSEVFLEAL